MKTLQELTRKNIWDLAPYSCARNEFSGRNASVYLDANENPFNNPYNRYPDPLQLELKDKLSKVKGVPVDNIFLGNGSDEASATGTNHGDVSVVGVLDHIGGTVDGLELLGAACLLGAILDAAQERMARDAGARHGVDVERLGLDDLMGERLKRVLAYADGFVVVRAVDVGQGILGERARHGKRCVVAHDLRGIGAWRVTGPLVGLGAPGACKTGCDTSDACDDGALGERPTRACLHDEPP